jgi:hypothetical protein
LVFGIIHEVADLFFESFLSLREVVAFKVAIAANRRRPQFSGCAVLKGLSLAV